MPYELWYGRKPDLSNLRELGCSAWVYNMADNPKIYDRSIKCVLVGYSGNSKAYRCWDRTNGRIHITRNVTFAESQDSRPRPLHPGVILGDVVPEEDDASSDRIVEEEDAPRNSNAPDSEPRRSTRSTKPSVAGTASKGIPHESNMDRVHEEIRASNECTHLRKADAALYKDADLTLLSSDNDPKDFKDAMSHADTAEWRTSIGEEVQSLKDHNVFTLIPRKEVPVGRKVIPSKAVFHYKLDESGNVARRKSRIVAKGFAQKPGIDFNETYAPVARMESMRTVLHIGATHDWDIHQMDIKTAFLHGELEEEIYMEQPAGAKEPGKEDHVARLNKTLYRLMQAAREWNKRLNAAMVEMGYVRITVDHCVYTRMTKVGTSIVAVHVDDMVATASTAEEMMNLKADLRKVFDLVDLGEVQWLLGMGVKRDRKLKTIALSQTAYIEKISKRLRLDNANPIWTPLDKNVILSKAQCPMTEHKQEDMKKHPYLVAVGSMMYAAMGTRPDVAFAVAHLSQFSSNPRQTHWTAAQRVIRYLLTTKDKCLMLGGSKPLTLVGYTDSDWGSDVNCRRSVSGYVFTLGGGAITWSSKKQPTVVTSSTEGEYMASCHATKEAIWLRTLLKLIGFGQTVATTIYCDNESAIMLTKDPSFHARTKHIDIQHHFVREHIESGDVKFIHLPTHEMPAGALTKPLTRPQFRYLVKGLGMTDPNEHLTA
jgi:hypothetical protein